MVTCYQQCEQSSIAKRIPEFATSSALSKQMGCMQPSFVACVNNTAFPSGGFNILAPRSLWNNDVTSLANHPDKEFLALRDKLHAVDNTA